MGADMFHLAWFYEGASPQAWGRPFTGAIGRDWMNPDFSLDLARILERARFDYVLIEDSSYVADAHGKSMDIYLRSAIATPRQDPAVVANLMLGATSRIGIVPTLATFAYPPYLAARLIGTLDQVSAGRAGWNVVTGSSTRAAQNFGLDDQAEHDLRYDMADEYMEVVNRLWDSWEPGAIVNDAAAGVFADYTKVHTIDFEGKYYKVRGPLNSGPLPQGRPAIAQAGGSPRGREFAATYAHTVVTYVDGVEAMKEYRADVRARMAALGRDPADCKVLFLVSPVIGGTEEEAQERVQQREHDARELAEIRLAHFAKITNIDFSELAMDEPLGQRELRTNGHQQSLEQFVARNQGKTLREAAVGLGGSSCVDLVGTPDSIAAQMDEVMTEVGGDGFLFVSDDLNRRTLSEVADGLVPALQRRGLTRAEYAHAQFTDNLLEY
jgi:FMN-dependent oxidoreductase (nitrilotriacetate monooxygenase family)